jgi:hypothetical protein
MTKSIKNIRRLKHHTNFKENRLARRGFAHQPLVLYIPHLPLIIAMYICL